MERRKVIEIPFWLGERSWKAQYSMAAVRFTGDGIFVETVPQPHLPRQSLVSFLRSLLYYSSGASLSYLFCFVFAAIVAERSIAVVSLCQILPSFCQMSLAPGCADPQCSLQKHFVLYVTPQTQPSVGHEERMSGPEISPTIYLGLIVPSTPSVTVITSSS